MSQLLIFTDKKNGRLRTLMVEPGKHRRKPNAPRYGYAEANAMFSAEQTALIRFLLFKKPVPCALCGKKSKRHWTTLVPFQAVDVYDPRNFVSAQVYSDLFPPLTPVCDEHPLKEDRETMHEMVAALRYFCQLSMDRWEREEKEKAAKEKAAKGAAKP